jgi:uncharacterized membrane protein
MLHYYWTVAPKLASNCSEIVVKTLVDGVVWGLLGVGIFWQTPYIGISIGRSIIIGSAIYP